MLKAVVLTIVLAVAGIAAAAFGLRGEPQKPGQDVQVEWRAADQAPADVDCVLVIRPNQPVQAIGNGC